MPKFILPGKPKGRKVINDRYVFVDGEMPASTRDAQMLEKILCRYHGCELVYEDVKAVVEEAPAKASSLKTESTRTFAKAKAETKEAE